MREADRNTIQSIDQNKLQTSQQKRSYWLQKYVLSLTVFFVGIWVVKGIIGGNTCLDWIMSVIVGGGFGLVNFAWWKAREGRVGKAGRKWMSEIKCHKNDAGLPVYTSPGVAGSPDPADDLKL